MQTTANYGLKKPDAAIDNVDIAIINENMDKTDAQMKANADAVAAHSADYVRNPAYGATTGSANAYLFTSTPVLSTLEDGVSAYLYINVANTGASTLDWDGTGAKAIVNGKGVALTSGKLPLHCLVGVRYNASTSSFQLLGEGGEYGTATADKTLTGYSIGTDIGLVDGTMPNRGTFNLGLGVSVPSGYYTGGTTADGKGYATGNNYYDSSGVATITGLLFQPGVVIIEDASQRKVYNSKPSLDKMRYDAYSAADMDGWTITSNSFSTKMAYSSMAFTWKAYQQ